MADPSERDLDCEVCCEEFDHAARRPKLLPCGHTVCMACVTRLHSQALGRNDGAFQCPIDRKKTRCRPAKLNDNHYILSLIDKPPKTEKPEVASNAGGDYPHPRFWCLDCNEEADSVCERKHKLLSIHQKRSEQMKPTVTVLERAVETQRHLTEGLSTIEATIRDFVTRQVAETRAVMVRGEQAFGRLYDNLDLVGPEWDRVQAEVEEARQSSEQRLAADEHSLLLLAAKEGKCEVRVAAQSGKTWRADVDLDAEGMAVVRGLLLLMQRADMLRLNKREVRERKTARVTKASPTKALPMPSLQELSMSVAEDRRAEKDAALQRDFSSVSSLSGLRCDRDPAWVRLLLKKLGPRLEDLGLEGQPQMEHRVALQGMPRLKSLCLKYDGRYEMPTGLLMLSAEQRILRELKLDMPLFDMPYWIRRFPAESIHIALPDTVPTSDPDLLKASYAMRCISRSPDVTLVRTLAQRERHSALCLPQVFAFGRGREATTRCSACDNRCSARNGS